jgi:hypothetical protein
MAPTPAEGGSGGGGGLGWFRGMGRRRGKAAGKWEEGKQQGEEEGGGNILGQSTDTKTVKDIQYHLPRIHDLKGLLRHFDYVNCEA